MFKKTNRFVYHPEFFLRWAFTGTLYSVATKGNYDGKVSWKGNRLKRKAIVFPFCDYLSWF